DTSCSSSLAALHLAVASLRRGECGSAVVAAVNLLSHPYHLRLLTDLGLLAAEQPDGAFDGGTAGWTPGEGVAAVLLRLRAAAELSQLTKVLLQLRHRQIAPTPMSARPAPLVSWAGTGLRPADRLSVWTGDRPRRALVNAIGATGSYGHAVLREAQPYPGTPVEDGAQRYLVPLSAQTDEQLATLAGRLHAHLVAQRRIGRAPRLADV